jgi:hypothetical protein
VKTVVAALPDHLAVCLRIKLEAFLLQGRGLWKMTTKSLEDTTVSSRFQQERTWRRLLVRKYPDMVAWWEKYVKRKIVYLFIQAVTARNREDMKNENFFITLVYTTY